MISKLIRVPLLFGRKILEEDFLQDGVHTQIILEQEIMDRLG